MIDSLIEELFAGLVIAVLIFLFRFLGFWGVVHPLPFWRGWCDEDRGMSECPYPLNTGKARAWRTGWAKSREQMPGDDTKGNEIE